MRLNTPDVECKGTRSSLTLHTIKLALLLAQKIQDGRVKHT